jgi:hypothetical protein
VLPSSFRLAQHAVHRGFSFHRAEAIRDLAAIRSPVHAAGFSISAREGQGFGSKTQIIGAQ